METRARSLSLTSIWCQNY